MTQPEVSLTGAARKPAGLPHGHTRYVPAADCFHRLKMMVTACLLLCVSLTTHAESIEVIDDTGFRVVLPQPVTRIVSLAPHLTELMFSIGASDKIVATVQSADYPEAATKIPRVGDSASIDLERVIALHPDLVLVWQSSNGSALATRLRELNLPVFVSEPVSLAQIESTLRVLGKVTGRQHEANTSADAFAARVKTLQRPAPGQNPLRVFYQIWGQPIFTVGGQHLISEIIQMCGGENIFSHLPALAGQVTVESVLAANPDLIIASGNDDTRPEWLDEWRHWPQLPAVQQQQLHFIPPALIQRHTLRVLEGVGMMCGMIGGSYKL